MDGTLVHRFLLGVCPPRCWERRALLHAPPPLVRFLPALSGGLPEAPSHVLGQAVDKAIKGSSPPLLDHHHQGTCGEMPAPA